MMTIGRPRLGGALSRHLFATSALTSVALVGVGAETRAQSLPTGASVAYGNVGFQRSSAMLR